MASAPPVAASVPVAPVDQAFARDEEPGDAVVPALAYSCVSRWCADVRADVHVMKPVAIS
jgi:hypothetical protein